MQTSAFGDLEVLDAHAHFFSHAFFDALAGQAPRLAAAEDRVARVGEATGWTMPPRDPAALGRAWVDELDRHGVATALLMSSIPGDEASVAAAVAAYPTRIAGSFMLDPTRDDRLDRATAAFDEYGLRVACLFPAMHRFSVADSEGARAVVALSEARPGTAVFVHFGALSVGVRKKLGLASLFDMRFSNPLDLHPVACEFPDVRFVIPHFGAGMFRETMMVADLCPNVYVDTSSSNRWTAYLPGATDLAAVFRKALDVVGHERLLFGSDSSFFPRGWNRTVFDAQTEALERAGATDDHARAIFGGNLRRILALG
jgi:predicted TIM-barrel fold metal-dependent hydrolase